LDVDGNTTLDSLNASKHVDFDETLNVDGATTLNSTLDVDGRADFNENVWIDGTLDVDGNTTLDSLNASKHVDFDETLNVDGATTLNSTLDVDGRADFNENVWIDGTLDVDGNTTLDSLNASKHVDFDETLNVDGNATFNDFVTFNDSAMVEKHLRVNTPYMDPTSVSISVRSQPELEVRNPSGSKIFQVDGHDGNTTIQNLTVQNSMSVLGNFTAMGDISGDDINASSYMSAGTPVFGTTWPSNTDWNKVTRKDYVDYHRMAQTDVPTAFSYDASLSGINTAGNVNDAVYYLNGNVVLYADSATTAANDSANYTITVKGANFQNLLTSIGGTTDVSAQLWLENNSVDLTFASHQYTVVDDNTITFTVGYGDIDPMTDCTSGIVRPTLALGTATGGFHMTGLHFFFDIVE
jgi:cytoskeletal protein CcmA (bactofilin family)